MAGLAVAVGVAVAVGIASASHQTSPQADPARQQSAHAPQQPALRLAAWTVTKQADGDISVTLRQLRDPAGLQATLEADGVPASVTFQQLNASCQAYPAGAPLLNLVFPKPYQDLPSAPPGAPRTTHVVSPASRPSSSVTLPSPDSSVIVIDPAALPSHAGVQLASSSISVALLLPRLVYESSQCTG